MPIVWKPRTILILAGTAAYWLVILVGTHAPGNVVPGGGHNDKVFHFVAFVGLAVLLCSCAACFRRPGFLLYAAIIGLAACYGIVDELTQTLVKNRTADSMDWLADVCGAIAGTLIFALGMWLFRRRERDHGATG